MAGRTFRRWGLLRGSEVSGDTLKEILGPQPFFSLSLPRSCHKVSSFAPPLLPDKALWLTTGPKQWSQLTTNWNLWTISQNISFFLLSCLSLVFCHSNTNLTNTMTICKCPVNEPFHLYCEIQRSWYLSVFLLPHMHFSYLKTKKGFWSTNSSTWSKRRKGSYRQDYSSYP
jgi:hypothetical protein